MNTNSWCISSFCHFLLCEGYCYLICLSLFVSGVVTEQQKISPVLTSQAPSSGFVPLQVWLGVLHYIIMLYVKMWIQSNAWEWFGLSTKVTMTTDIDFLTSSKLCQWDKYNIYVMYLSHRLSYEWSNC